jgi:hypothetical protein
MVEDPPCVLSHGLLVLIQLAAQFILSSIDTRHKVHEMGRIVAEYFEQSTGSTLAIQKPEECELVAGELLDFNSLLFEVIEQASYLVSK